MAESLNDFPRRLEIDRRAQPAQMTEEEALSHLMAAFPGSEIIESVRAVADDESRHKGPSYYNRAGSFMQSLADTDNQ